MTTATQVPAWTLPDRLAKARRHAQLTQDDIAKYIGLSKRAVSAFETGDRQPRLGYLRLWAERCNVPIEWLQGGDVRSRCPSPFDRRVRPRLGLLLPDGRRVRYRSSIVTAAQERIAINAAA